MVKNLPTNAREARDWGLMPGGRKTPCKRKWQASLVVLPGKSHGQRIQQATVHGVTKESDMTRTCTHIAFFFSFYHSTTTFTHFYFIPGNATTTKKSFLIVGRKLTSFFCIFKEYMFLFIFTKCYHILIVFLS